MEGTISPIISHVKANIASALSDTRTDRADAKVQTLPFQEYLIFEKAIGYRTPSLFVLGREIDFKLDRGANFINCLVGVQVSCVVDERDAELLTIKTWRYHDALHEVLDRAELVSSDGKIKNKIKVVRSSFGDTVQVKSSIESPFRKEVMLTLDVEHFEQE